MKDIKHVHISVNNSMSLQKKFEYEILCKVFSFFPLELYGQVENTVLKISFENKHNILV